MAEVNKNNVYISKGNLEYVLGKLRDKNEALYLRKGAEAVSAAKVKNALTLTVGGTDVVFDGSEVKSAAVAAASHKHAVTDINDFSKEVKKVVFGDENSGTVAAHTHSNLTVLEKISDEYITAWNAKIGVNDVEKLKYTNATAMPGVDNVKDAIDILVKNIQINSAVLSDATANVNGLATKLTAAEGKITALENANKEGGAVANAIADAKKAGTDAQTAANEAKAAIADEQARAQAAEKKNADAIAAINNETTGILKQAKDYADGKDAAIAAAKKAGDDAQKDIDALAGKVGEVPADKTVIGLIGEAKAQADQGVADAAAEANRAKAVEQGLRTDLGDKDDVAAANGSAFARIAQVKVDLTNEAITARTAEKKAQDQADANKAAIEILNGDDQTPGSVKKQIADKIAEVNQVAEGLENRVAANEAAIKVINGVGEGSIKKAVADLVNGAPEAMDTLKELADSITTHQSAYDAYVAQVTKDIAAAEKAAKDYADGKDTTLHTAITGEIATAKQEAIDDAASKDTALENKLQGNINKKVDQSAYDTKVAALEKADTDNLAAAKKFAQDEDKKITDVIGTDADASTANTVFGKIKALQEKNSAQDEVISAKAAAADLDALEALVGGKDDTKDADTAFGKIAAETARADAAEKALGGRIDTADGKITALENELDAEQTGLKARMTTAEADIDSLQSDMTSAQGDINTINANITAIQNQIAVLTSLTDEELQAMLDQVYTGM